MRASAAQTRQQRERSSLPGIACVSERLASVGVGCTLSHLDVLCTLDRAMPRHRSLTDTDVAVAALAVIDRGGLDAFTMRAVAAELGMATMSIYRYVSNRE